MERAAQLALLSFQIELRRNAQRVGIGLDHRVEERVDPRDPSEVFRGQLPARQRAGGHQRLELWDGRFLERVAPEKGPLGRSLEE